MVLIYLHSYVGYLRKTFLSTCVSLPVDTFLSLHTNGMIQKGLHWYTKDLLTLDSYQNGKDLEYTAFSCATNCLQTSWQWMCLYGRKNCLQILISTTPIILSLALRLRLTVVMTSAQPHPIFLFIIPQLCWSIWWERLYSTGCGNAHLVYSSYSRDTPKSYGDYSCHLLDIPGYRSRHKFASTEIISKETHKT